MTVESLSNLLEEEFALAFPVKDEKALRRTITLLTSNLVQRDQHSAEFNNLSTDIRLLATRMEEGFKRFDARFESNEQRFISIDQRFVSIDKRFETIEKRFETVDKRFDSMDRRFDSMDKRFDSMDARFNRITVLISLGFLMLTALITVFQFLG